jgi:hypothetical protein
MKEWTIMVYMAGDNNLSADMAYALEEIREVIKSKSEKLNLMVYYDSSAISAPTVYCDFTEYKNPVYVPSFSVEKTFKSSRHRRGNNERSLTDDNSAAVYSILNFVDWCVNKVERRAKKYAFIFSGHSSAFQNMSFLVDTSSDYYYMTIPKLRWALKQITKKEPPFKKDTRLLGQEIDILGFDSCVMGMLELGYGFSKYAKTMVASEGNIPSAGWTYGDVLTGLISSSASQSETDIAASFVTNFIERQNKYIIGGVSVDLAAWDLTKVEDVVAATDNLAIELNKILKDKSSKNYPYLKKALLTCHWECQSYMLEQNVDLKDFCQLLQTEIKGFDPENKTALWELCNTVIEAIDKCILMCGFSGGRYQYSNGISLFFPWSAFAFYTSKENYDDLSVFYEKKLDNWKKFLEEFLTIHTRRKARQEIELGKKEDAAIKAISISGGFYPAEKNNQLVNDKDAHTANDKDAHTANDKDAHTANDKGLFFLLTQFKNTESPWNISGFTKKLQKDEKKRNAEK